MSNKFENLKHLNTVYKKNVKDKCKKYTNISNKHELPACPRIVVIGDLHGDYNQTIESLKIADLIDYKDNDVNWIGRDTVVVQVGDQIDRCRDLPCSRELDDDENSDIKILKLFTNLHNQAIKTGGAVYSIIGNHELMNVDGRMEYVSRMNIDNFEEKEENKEFLNRKPKKLVDMDARKWAFKPGNPLAEFLACTRKLSLKIGKSLFVHAGILKEISSDYKISNLNQILSLYLLKKLKKPQEYIDVLGPDLLKENIKAYTGLNKKKTHKPNCQGSDCFHISPLWNRKIGNIDDTEEHCNELLTKVFEDYGVDRMIVGHTPQIYSGITSKCNGRIWFVDYGSSNAFNIADNIFQVTNQRSQSRETQVLEILNDGQTVNVIKK
tara:strand:+ start:470 stop:1612 length:1143 start_codon:yes stop_codon:yes gene_type:complete